MSSIFILNAFMDFDNTHSFNNYFNFVLQENFPILSVRDIPYLFV